MLHQLTPSVIQGKKLIIFTKYHVSNFGVIFHQMTSEMGSIFTQTKTRQNILHRKKEHKHFNIFTAKFHE